MKLKAPGRRRRRPRRRRAGLSDAGAHRRRGARRHRRQLHEVHDQLRHRRAEAGHRRALPRSTTASTTPPTEVIVTAGGKQALFNAALALFGPGDEVITHMPGWPTLVEQIKLADATPVIVHTHAGGRLPLQRRRRSSRRSRRARAASSSTRRQSDRRADVGSRAGDAVAEEAARRGIWILLDLCYEKLIYDPVPHNLPASSRGTMRDRLGALRLGVEGLRDDRLALRLGGRRRPRVDRRVQRAPEPLDVERLLDHAEGGRSRR